MFLYFLRRSIGVSPLDRQCCRYVSGIGTYRLAPTFLALVSLRMLLGIFLALLGISQQTFLELSLLFLHGLSLALHADFLDGITYDLNRVEAVDGNSCIGKYFSNNGIHYIGMVHSDLYDGLLQFFWYLHQDCNDVANLQALHISNEGVLFAMPILVGQENICTWVIWMLPPKSRREVVAVEDLVQDGEKRMTRMTWLFVSVVSSWLST